VQSIYPCKALSYKLDFTFDKGTYGTFWQATIFDKNSPRNQEKVAVKIIPLDAFNRDHTIEEQWNEIHKISRCHHVNVLTYYTSFTNEKQLWIVMPLCKEGTLDHVLKEKFKQGIKDEALIASILL